MEKKTFVKYLDSIFATHGFRKKGNSWRSGDDMLLKIIELQKSRFGNMYYLNYGFIFKDLELEDFRMHLYYGLGSNDSNENNRIKELLNLEKDIPDDQREKELKYFIEKNMLKDFESLNSKIDIVNSLQKRPHLNDVPLVVKKYLNLN